MIRDGLYVVGTGCSEFGERPEASFDDLVEEAVREALWDAGVGPGEVDGVWLASSDVGERRREGGGLSGTGGFCDVPLTRIVGEAAAGGDAFRNAALAVASGEHELVLVVGAEKQSHRPAADNFFRLPLASSHPVYAFGVTPVAVAGLYASRMMASGSLTREHLDAVLVKNRLCGERNPRAFWRSRVHPDAMKDAAMLAEPLTILDVAPRVDGAAAVLLARREDPKRFRAEAVRVTGVGYSAVGGDLLPFFDPQVDFLGRRAPRTAALHAFTRAAVVNPWDQISVAEVDDSTTVGELLAYEDISLCSPGEAGAVISQGLTGPRGQLPVNPSGGSLSCGSAPAADVLRRIHEIVRQLTGRAEDRQVAGARTGLVHGSAGAGAVGFAAILEAVAKG